MLFLFPAFVSFNLLLSWPYLESAEVLAGTSYLFMIICLFLISINVVQDLWGRVKVVNKRQENFEYCQLVTPGQVFLLLQKERKKIEKKAKKI